MPNRYTLFLPHSLYNAMVAHTRVEHPRECCGLVAGRLAGPIVEASEAIPLVNSASSPEIEYLSEPRSMFSAIKAMRSTGLDVVAVYHSHPTSAPIPSRKDCASNYSESVMNLILSIAAGQAQMRGWWLSANGFEEGGVGICGN